MRTPIDVSAFNARINRRAFLARAGVGLGGLALGSLLTPAQAMAMGALGTPHIPARAKRVIHLCMAGGPSHLESFDPKPELDQLNGQPFPESFTKGQQLAQLQNTVLKARGSFVKFKRWGKSGQEISTLFPHIGAMADDIAIVRSMVTEQINHDPAQAFMNSGSILKGRPSMGSWLLYGLGAETDSLPGFIVFVSQTKGGGIQPVSARQWGAGFLPSRFQGIQFQSRGDAVHYVGNPEGVCQSQQRLVVDEVQRLNSMLADERYDPEIQTRISQYEMAFRMQMSVPELTDLSNEPQSILDMYGVKQPGDGSFASNCLLARRLAERGVRFIQLYHRGWDHHGEIEKNMPISAMECDQPSAALIADLKQRGMLDDTLVIWGGEFGRTPMGQGSGRDHHILGFSLFLAGAGIKGGITHGATDELGYRSVDKIVSMHDLHATLLHQCGIDHERFTVKFQGLDAKLTGVEPARVVTELLAQMHASPLLQLTSISKSFDGIAALKDVSFDLMAGEVHALVGENGAGKSTLVKIIAGAEEPDAGTILIGGRPVLAGAPQLARSLGVAVIYQQPALFPDLTVAENIALRSERRRPLGSINWEHRRQIARKLLDEAGCGAHADALAGSLSMPQQQLVEIAAALGADARILILDEPTASLSNREVENLFGLIDRLRARGVGMIYISHRLEELERIADRVTVLRDGRHIETGAMNTLSRDWLIHLMVGREINAVYPERVARPGDVVIETRNLSCGASGDQDISLTVRAGEILGLAGLVGSGRSELARILFGLTPATSGQILIDGKLAKIESPGDAVKFGIAYVPEDRRRHGVVNEMSVAANTTLAILRQMTRGGLIDLRRERELAESFVKRFAIRAGSISSAVATLSGGNQQKVALARWLATKPRVLILDEPTQGVDVGAKSEIHRLIGALADSGLAVILISSEMPEILGMSDRIAVMRHGQICATLSRDEASQEKLLAIALEGAAA